jgi:hypothetical protein
MPDISGDGMLETAYTWLCTRRRDDPPDADCGRLRREWPAAKARVQAELLAETSDIGWLS